MPRSKPRMGRPLVSTCTTPKRGCAEGVVPMISDPRPRGISLSHLYALVFLFTSSAGVSAQTDSTPVPNHAHANLFGDGWACSRGFVKDGQTCVAVNVPAN